jgi:hypothetical protein
MVMARQVLKLRRITTNKLGALTFPRRENFLLTALLVSILLLAASCGETAKTVVSPEVRPGLAPPLSITRRTRLPFRAKSSPPVHRYPPTLSTAHSRRQIPVSWPSRKALHLIFPAGFPRLRIQL